MDELLLADILLAFNSLSEYNSNPPNVGGMQAHIARQIQRAIIRYTHAYVGQQINALVLANQVGQPAHLNPVVGG